MRLPLLYVIILVGISSCAPEEPATAPNETPQAPMAGPGMTSAMNIVLILTDDQRAETISTMTRTLGVFGTNTVQFSRGFASTPLCCPARASILTGLHSHNHGVLWNGAPYGAPAFNDLSTVATWLQDAGYRTGYVGKYLNLYDKLTPWPYQPPGWTSWQAFVYPGYYNYSMVENGRVVPYGSSTAHYSTQVLGRQAVAFIDSTPPSQPFFLFFSPAAPHPPATPANQDKTLYGSLPKWRPASFNEPDVTDKPAWVRGLPQLAGSKLTANDRLRLDMLRSLQAVDRQVQNIYNALVRTNRLGNTVLIFASDNGYSWGEHRYTWKDCVYEECIRIPFLVRAPGVVSRIDTSLVALLDLAPSIAEWAGVTPPAAMNGASLAPLLMEPSHPWRQQLLLEVLYPDSHMLGQGVFSGVRTHRHTYAEHATGEVELYDLVADPLQLTNLADDPAHLALVQQLNGILGGLKTE